MCRVARGTVVREAERLHVFAFGEHSVPEFADPLAHAMSDTGRGGFNAPMPGRVVALLVKEARW